MEVERRRLAAQQREASRKVARMRKLFDQLDDDKSGTIDPQEVRKLGEALFGEELTDEQLEIAMAEMDPEGDGAVSFEEFMTWQSNEGDFRKQAVAAEAAAKRRKLREMFDKADVDGGGAIDTDEVYGLVRELFGDELSDLEMRRAMKEMDPDGSGEVDFAEFEAWYFGAGDFRTRMKEMQRQQRADAEQREQQQQAERARTAQLDFLRGLFNQTDVDGQGSLDTEEVGELIANAFGERLSEAQLANAMATMDPDGSGEVNFGEFYEWCTRKVDSVKTNTWWVKAQHELSHQAGLLQYHMWRSLQKWFGEADEDNSGELSILEVCPQQPQCC